jgi:hypothetical protein
MSANHYKKTVAELDKARAALEIFKPVTLETLATWINYCDCQEELTANKIQPRLHKLAAAIRELGYDADEGGRP